MNRKTGVVSGVVAAAVAVIAAYGVATWGRADHGHTTGDAMVSTPVGANPSGAADTPAVATAGDGAQEADVDLSGTWRFDPSRSDMPRWGDRGGPRGARPDGPGMGGRRGGDVDGVRRGEGLDGGRRGGRDGDGGRRGRFGGRMPSLMEIHQDAGAVMLADSTGDPFVEIRYDGTAPESAPSPSEDGPRVVAGIWKGASLEVSRGGPGGMSITQSFSLADGGQTLVIHNHMPAAGERPAREFKRVYRRVAGS